MARCRVPVGDSRSCPGRCVRAAVRCGLMLLAAGALPGGASDHAGYISWRSLTRTRSSGHDHRMPVPLFAHKPEQCPYGHSLAPGMPQAISWMLCICAPAREAGRQGRGMGHLTLWCGRCSAGDHRDTRFYEPPHQVSYSGPVSGWMTRPDA
jgi:hypothetical protein